MTPEGERLRPTGASGTGGTRVTGAEFVVGKLVAEGGQGGVYEVAEVMRGPPLSGPGPPTAPAAAAQALVVKLLHDPGHGDPWEARILQEIHTGHWPQPECVSVISQPIVVKGRRGLRGLVYPRLEGDIVSRLPMTVPNILRLLSHLLDATSCAHRKRIAHMDIKPENILVAPMGDSAGGVCFVLCDWGSALCCESPKMLLHGPSTACYAAPEVLECRGPVDPFACDIWSVGMTAVAALTGVDLASDDHMKLVTADPVAFAATRIPGLPGAFVDLLARMLARDPSARPTANQLLEHLRTLPSC